MWVNIGCGMTPTRGWENFDNSPSVRLSTHPSLVAVLRALGVIDSSQLNYISFCRNNNIRWADAARHIPLPDGSVEVLYSSHMLEHLDQAEARLFLAEAKRVIRKGGIIRIVVPDLEKIVDKYNRDKDADQLILAMHVCVARPRGLLQRLRMAVVGARHHQWMYDGRSLVSLLQECGFSDAVVLPSGETTVKNSGPLDLREREDESVYVEATNR